jgi:hypothetical protein
MKTVSASTRLSLHKESVFSQKYSHLFVLFLSLLLLPCCAANTGTDSQITIHSQTTTSIELLGYDALKKYTLFKGNIAADGECEIDTAYYGLGMFTFPQGQSYPVILGGRSFTIKIDTPSDPPSFNNSEENELLYNHLLAKEPHPQKSEKNTQFARLMIQGKQLLESSDAIRTIKELTARKNEFHEFVRKHYGTLKHSDMIRRLIAQYFMMHEYVRYHTEGTPPANRRELYQKAVVNGVGNWLEILNSHIPEHEIVNYCVSLYYNRGMVTLASLIVDNFQNVAYCPGVEKELFSFPDDLNVTEAAGNKKLKLDEFNKQKLIAFVSDDCPVSMVKTVIMARQLIDQKKDVMMIVAPLQKLSHKHLLMNRMVSNGNMLFINDENWRKNNLEKQIKLPLFLRIENDLELSE